MASCSERSPYLASAVSDSGKSSNTPLLQCTSHMCLVRVHWHVKLNYKEYWCVKITINNFNYRMNYTLWNLVVQHPNFDNLTQLFSFNYKSLTPYAGLSKFAMIYFFVVASFPFPEYVHNLCYIFNIFIVIMN